MRIFGKNLVLLDDAAMAAIKQAGHDVLEAPISAGQHLVAAFKASPEGQTLLNVMHTLEGSGSGIEKFNKAAAEAEPLLLQFVTGGGHSVVARIEDIAKEAVQSLFNDEFSAAKKAVTAVGTAATQVETQVVTGSTTPVEPTAPATQPVSSPEPEQPPVASNAEPETPAPTE